MTRIAAVTSVAVLVLLASVALAANVTVTFYFTNRGQPLEDPTRGRFYIYDKEQPDNYIAWGDGEHPAQVPPGVYRVVVRYVNDMIQEERVFEEVDLNEDLEHTVDFDVPVAGLTLWITSGGFPIPHYAGRYSLYHAGQRGKPIVSRRPGESVTISPGTYDIEVAYRGPDGLESKWLEGYKLETFQQETVDVGASAARVRLTLLDGGRPLAHEAGVWRVYRPGDHQRPLAEARTGDVLMLDAGVYDVALHFITASGERGERWLTDFEVSGDVERSIDVSAETDRLTIDIRNGAREVSDAWFALYAPGDHETEIYSARSGESLEIRPGTYDIGCFLRRGGVRAEQWLEGQTLSGPVSLAVDLDFQEASLRVRPQKKRSNRDEIASNLLVIVDSSSDMSTPFNGKTRLEAVQATLMRAVDTLMGTDANVGLRVFGITPRARQSCTDSTLLAPVRGLDRADLTRSLELLRPTGGSAIAYSLEQASGDLPAKGPSSVLLITGSTDSCSGDVCAAASRLMLDEGVSRIYVVALDAGRAEQRKLDCVGDYRRVRTELELESALLDIIREVRRGEDGTVTLFAPGGTRMVASGGLLDRIRVAAGTYDVRVRTGDKVFAWDGLEIRGDMVATAGSRPPRSR